MSAGYDVGGETPVFVISVAAQLAGLHAQTLRQYDRLGLVSPGRTPGGGRRYSVRDIERLREVQRLTADGVNLAAVKRILQLENEVDRLRAEVADLAAQLAEAWQAAERREAAAHAAYRRELVPHPGNPSGALVVWRPASRT
ncbi:MAG: heat shock protein transcriptional repressor HspR [Actinomycetota bacterium]